MMATVKSGLEIFPDAAEKVTDTAECRSFLGRVGQSTVQAARGIAPVRTGAYRDTIYGEVVEGGEPEAHVGSPMYYWHFIEFGSINNVAQRTLSKALEATTDRQDFSG